MTLLDIRSLVTGYGAIPVVHGIDLAIEAGQLVAVIGANGAGKTTLLRTIAGLMKPFSGQIEFDGSRIDGKSSAQVAAGGVAHVPENRRVFAQHSVEENLQLGAYVRRKDKAGIAEDTARMFEKFPILLERRKQAAGALSGGQQQMLAIAMALMARPRLLMLDEPSLGLAPIIVSLVFEEIARLRNEGTTILLVEQLAVAALKVADHAIVLDLGRVAKAGKPDELRNDEVIRAAYLGT